MSEWAVLKTVGTVLSTAYESEEGIQRSYEAALQNLEWKRYINACEQRIISAVKEVEFKQYTRRLANLSDWWTITCVGFLAQSG